MQLPVLSLIACLLLPVSFVAAAEAPANHPVGMPLWDLVAREYSTARIIMQIETIGRSGVVEAMPQVARYSVHASPEIRLAAIQTLGRFGGKADVTKPVIAALADVDSRVQVESVRVLGVVKAKVALPQLIALAGITNNDDFRAEVLKAITAITVD